MAKIYSIIVFIALKKIRRRVNFILNRKLKFYTKEFLRFFNVTLFALGIIIAIVLIKYKPVYEVKIDGEVIGYTNNKQNLEKDIEESTQNYKGKNINKVEITETPEYEYKLVEKNKETNESEIIIALQKNMKIEYEYYNLELNGEIIEAVNSKEDAETIKEQLGLQDIIITQMITENVEEINTHELEVAKNNVAEKTQTVDKTTEIANINGIEIATLPITGTISSRYGVSSRIRSSTHTGLDIAASTGTPIKVIADGTVTSAQYTGSYGYLVKVEHGNGVESWYAHTSKMYVKAGDEVKAGDVIAAVGSTGNSTGPHLHLEIRINGQHVNPQKYIYNN